VNNTAQLIVIIILQSGRGNKITGGNFYRVFVLKRR